MKRSTREREREINSRTQQQKQDKLVVTETAKNIYLKKKFRLWRGKLIKIKYIQESKTNSDYNGGEKIYTKKIYIDNQIIIYFLDRD